MSTHNIRFHRDVRKYLPDCTHSYLDLWSVIIFFKQLLIACHIYRKYSDRSLSKQCRPRSDTSECGFSSSTVCAFIQQFLGAVAKLLPDLEYHIQPNYHIYPYKCTAKQFRIFQVTARVLFVYFFLKAYVVGTHLICIDLSHKLHNICFYKENKKA